MNLLLKFCFLWVFSAFCFLDLNFSKFSDLLVFSLLVIFVRLFMLLGLFRLFMLSNLLVLFRLFMLFNLLVLFTFLDLLNCWESDPMPSGLFSYWRFCAA